MDTESYLMGIFDGEGCVGTGKGGNGRWYVQMSVTMASEDVCRLFMATWGGGISKRTKPTVGGLILWTWHINASHAIPFLEHVVQHSLVKREQARLALGLARNIAKYSWARKEDGFNPFKGGRFISEEDMAERERVIAQIRSLNGARSRYAALPVQV